MEAEGACPGAQDDGTARLACWPQADGPQLQGCEPMSQGAIDTRLCGWDAIY